MCVPLNRENGSHDYVQIPTSFICFPKNMADDHVTGNQRCDICSLTERNIRHVQPSQNVPAASYLATYNKISAAYFEFTFVRVEIRMRLFQGFVPHCKL